MSTINNRGGKMNGIFMLNYATGFLISMKLNNISGAIYYFRCRINLKDI